MIKRADTNNASTNYHYARMGLHLTALPETVDCGTCLHHQFA
jgi:hypothetical protein